MVIYFKNVEPHQHVTLRHGYSPIRNPINKNQSSRGLMGIPTVIIYSIQNARKITCGQNCISALLTMPKTLTVWITINWEILKEIGIPDHLTCLLRNVDAGQEAIVRTGHGTTDWFQIGKGVHQGCKYIVTLLI